MYSKTQLIIFTISNIALFLWVFYGFLKFNKWTKDILNIK